MLNNDRIKEADINVKTYLSDGLIKKEKLRDIVFETFMRNHRESLLVAKNIFNQNVSNLWVVVVSYYSMFYIANALLYKLGYKVSHKIAHKVTSDALITFARSKLKNNLIENYELAASEALALSDNLLENYNYEMLKRSFFQYESTEEIKFAKAKTSLERAEQFSKEIEKMIQDIEN